MNKNNEIILDTEAAHEPVGFGAKVIGLAKSVTSSPTMHRQID